MADETAAAPNVPTVAPGIPAVEVNPSNELLDGENLDRKRDLVEHEPVHVDKSGTRLEHDDDSAIPPPASANLELRQRTEKLIDATLSSIGKGPESPDSMVAALREERRGLAARAEGGDEDAKRRVKLVDEQLKARGASAEPKESEEPDTRERAAVQRQAVFGQKDQPAGRSAKPKSES